MTVLLWLVLAVSSLPVARRSEVSGILTRQAEHLTSLNQLVIQGAHRLQQREEELALIRADSASKDQQILGLKQEVEALRQKARIAQERLAEIARLSDRLQRTQKELAELEHKNSLATRVRENLPSSLEDAVGMVWQFIRGKEREPAEVTLWMGEPLPWTEWQRRYQLTIRELEQELSRKLEEAGRERVPPAIENG